MFNNIRLHTVLAVCIISISLWASPASFAFAPDTVTTSDVQASTNVVAGRIPGATDTAKARVTEHYGQLPLGFDTNQGQVDVQIHHLALGSGNKTISGFHQSRVQSACVVRRSACLASSEIYQDQTAYLPAPSAGNKPDSGTDQSHVKPTCVVRRSRCVAP